MSESKIAELEKRVAELEAESAGKTAVIRELLTAGAIEGLGENELEELLNDTDTLAELLDDLTAAQDTEIGVSLDQLLQFFTEAVEGLDGAALSERLEEKLASFEKGDGKNVEERMALIRSALDEFYVSVWATQGVDDETGSKAVMNAGFLLGDIEDPEEQQALNDSIEQFQDSEDRLIGELILGKEEYTKRVNKKLQYVKMQDEIMENLKGMNPVEGQAYIQSINAAASDLQMRLQAMGPAKASAYLNNPSEEDEEKIMRFQAFQMIMQSQMGGGHGHSHNGQPCSGHGHAQHGHSHQPQQHGHSHNGKPCDGSAHGHSHHQQQHGHSHNGKPCDGSAHGHSH